MIINTQIPIPNGYVKPSGSITILTNNTYDITNYASAIVNVSVEEVDIPLADNCAWGVSSSNTSYIIADDSTEVFGS